MTPSPFHHDDPITDSMVERLLVGKDEGRSFPDTLAQFSIPPTKEETDALREVWGCGTVLMRQNAKISPDPALLHRCLEALPLVTEAEGVGYERQEAPRPLPSIIHQFQLSMQTYLKYGIPALVVVVAVVAVMGQSDTPTPAPEMAMMAQDAAPAESMMMMRAADPAPVSGEVDDLIASLSSEADLDVTQFADASADIQLMNSDTQSLNDLTTAYDESTF